MNNVTIMGRLTRDAEVTYAQSNDTLAIARMTLAVDRRVKAGEEKQADFISCKAFGKTAEFLEKYGRKGTKFAIVGHIQTGSYDDKDGKKVYTTDVIIDNCEFAESKSSESAAPAQAAAQTQAAAPAPAAPEASSFMDIPAGLQTELPFV